MAEASIAVAMILYRSPFSRTVLAFFLTWSSVHVSMYVRRAPSPMSVINMPIASVRSNGPVIVLVRMYPGPPVAVLLGVELWVVLFRAVGLVVLLPELTVK